MAGYTNPLIQRVQADIAQSQARNRLFNQLAARGSGSLGLGSGTGSSSTGTGGVSFTTSPRGVSLASIGTPWGQHVTVNKNDIGKFSQLMQGLNALGYHPKSVGGYNYRNIAGTNKLSKHATGEAIDFDPQQNKGGRLGGGGTRYGYFDPNKVIPLVRRLGISWGGVWQNPDPMHFSIGEG